MQDLYRPRPFAVLFRKNTPFNLKKGKRKKKLNRVKASTITPESTFDVMINSVVLVFNLKGTITVQRHVVKAPRASKPTYDL